MSRIDDIDARAKAATDGPWEHYAGASCEVFSSVIYEDDSYEPPDVTYGSDREADAEFIAHARQDIPDLVTFVHLVADELEGADDFDGLNADAVQRMQWHLDRLNGATSDG